MSRKPRIGTIEVSITDTDVFKLLLHTLAVVHDRVEQDDLKEYIENQLRVINEE